MKLYLLLALLQFCFVPSKAESAILVQEPSVDNLHQSALVAMEQKEYGRAEEYIRRLLQRNSLFLDPSGKSAWYLLGLVLEKSGEKITAMETLSQGLDSLRSAGLFDCYLGFHLARLYAENQVDEKSPEITMLIYEVLTKINRQKQADLWQDIAGLVHVFLSKTEQQELRQTEKDSVAHTRQLLQSVFRREDPNPLTQQNEWLPVLFRRTATAKLKYASRISPEGYDDRGAIYIRLGKPWKIFSEHSGVLGDYGYAIQPYEMWFYIQIHPDLYFTFMRERGHGEYRLVDGPESLLSPFYQRRNSILNRNDAGRTANNLRIYLYENIAPIHETFRSRLYRLQDQVSPMQAVIYARMHFKEEDSEHAALVDTLLQRISYDTESGHETLPLELSVEKFRSKNDSIRLEISYGIPNRALLFTADESGDYTQLFGEIGILDDKYTTLRKDSLKYFYRIPAGKSVNRGGFVSKWAGEMAPGQYHLYFRMENPNGNRTVVFRDDLNIPAFDEDSLQISDIQLAKNIYPSGKKDDFVKRGLFVLPAPAKLFMDDDPVFMYFEIYNLALSDQGKTRYQIEFSFATPAKKKGFFRSLTTFWRRKEKAQKTILKIEKCSGDSAIAVEYAKFDRRRFPAGTVRMNIRVEDLISHRQASRTVSFKIEGK